MPGNGFVVQPVYGCKKAVSFLPGNAVAVYRICRMQKGCCPLDLPLSRQKQGWQFLKKVLASPGGQSKPLSMKAPAPLLVVLATAFSVVAGPTNVFENNSPHFSTRTPIIWKAPTGHLPTRFWVYRKTSQMFSETTISNAIVLASFQEKGFPKPSTNQTVLSADRFYGEPEPPYFAIYPEWGQITYTLRDRAPDSTGKVSDDAAAVQRAWDCLLQLGLDRCEFVKINAATPGTWGVFLPRQIDGIQTYYESAGFLFQQYAKGGKIRCFSITLPNLERLSNSPTATREQIIACMRAFKTPMVPENKPDYFIRLKALTKAKTVTIIRITPYYSEGIFAELPTNNELPTIVMPLAELEAVADFGNSNATIRVLTPILSSEVNRLLNEYPLAATNPVGRDSVGP